MDSHNDLYVVHRSGAPRHFLALRHSKRYNVREYEYTFSTITKKYGVKVPTMRNANKTLPNIKFLCQLLMERDRDLIVGAPPFDVRAPYFSRLSEKHNVLYYTSWPYWSGSNVPKPTRWDKIINKWRDFLGDAKVITVTDAAKQSIQEFGFSATRIPHCVDTGTFRPLAQKNKNGCEHTILFVGRLVEEKGINYLIDAVQDIDDGNIKVEFVGDGPLKQQIRDAHSNSLVNYAGYISSQKRLSEKMSNADVLVLPSYDTGQWEELFGIVLIEAMACGTPVIATNCIGPNEIIDDGETGYIVPQQDSSALADKIEYILQDNALREEMGQKCRSVAIEEYDITKVANQWASVIESTQ